MSTPPDNTPKPISPTARIGQALRKLWSALGLRTLRLGRRGLIVLIVIVSSLTIAMAGLLVRYIAQPAPIPDLLPVGIDYPPHFMYTIIGVNQPMGVALSPDGKKLYVTEVNGDRQVKILETDTGKIIREVSPPTSTPGERAPVYVTVDAIGRLYVSDRLQHAIFIYSGEGDYLDTILESSMTLSGYVLKQAGELPANSIYYFNIFMAGVQYKLGGASDWKVAPPPDKPTWSPLGLSISPDGRLLVTNIGNQESQILAYPAGLTTATSRAMLPLEPEIFGAFGNDNGQLTFPNDAVVDSKGRYYVADSNNGRISVWDAQFNYLFFFGQGNGTGGLGLPHGAYMDSKDRLFVADATAHNVKVYNASGDRPVFLYSFGEHGPYDGQFNYPNDVVMSSDGKLYIADRANDRIAVWSY